MSKRRDLAGAPERRAVNCRLEFRGKSSDGLILEGYASVFDAPYDVYGGPPMGWSEVVDRKAFNRTLAGNPDLHLLINHEGMPLARTKSGTLTLSTDDHGLKVRATLDPADPDVQRLQPKMDRGDMDEMSFAFRVPKGGDLWNEDESERRLVEVNIDKGDVSVVNFGANPATDASLNRALEMIAEADEDLIAELRNATPASVLESARKSFARLTEARGETRKTLSVSEALKLLDR